MLTDIIAAAIEAAERDVVERCESLADDVIYDLEDDPAQAAGAHRVLQRIRQLNNQPKGTP